MAKKKVLVLASNLDSWAEGSQGPWDALADAGHEITLATGQGLTPLPLAFSVDPEEFVDPQLDPGQPGIRLCPDQGAAGDRRLGSPDQVLRREDGGLRRDRGRWQSGSPLDVSGNAKVHKLIVDAWTQGKLIGALCYAVGALVWARNPETGKSIIWRQDDRRSSRPWDFTGDLPYPLYNEVPGNGGMTS